MEVTRGKATAAAMPILRTATRRESFAVARTFTIIDPQNPRCTCSRACRFLGRLVRTLPHGCIPNFAVFSGGRLVRQQAGVVNHDQMKQWLSAAAAVSA